MPRTKTMTIDDAIRQVGTAITEIDVLRSKFDREDDNRKQLDNIRDDLDVAQRKLVRNRLTQSTKEFQRRAASLRETNQKVLKDIQKLEVIAQTLEGLVALVNAAQKLVKLFV